MKTHFSIEVIRLRAACNQALDHIMAARISKQRVVANTIYERFMSRWWERPFDFFFRPERLGNDYCFLSFQFYNDDKVTELTELIEKHGNSEDKFMWAAACLYCDCSEDVCNTLLSACAVAKSDIIITADDWHTVSTWAKVGLKTSNIAVPPIPTGPYGVMPTGTTFSPTGPTGPREFSPTGPTGNMGPVQ